MRALILAVLFLFSAATQSADREEPPFDFERTLAIVILTEKGYVINQRPASPANYTGNFERQGFVQLYRLLEPYLYLLQLQENPQIPQGSAARWELIFVNPEEKQRYFIGEHWFGDGRHQVTMDNGDYRRLLSLFDGPRIPNQGSAEGYIERLQKRSTPEEVLPFPEYADDLPVPEASPNNEPENFPASTFPTIESATPSPTAAPTENSWVENPTAGEATPTRDANVPPPTRAPLSDRPSEAPGRAVADAAGNHREEGAPNFWLWIVAAAALAFAFIRTGKNN